MPDCLTTLGWSEIEVIDDDLGRSAAGGVQRAGFERMASQGCLGKVGAVAAREGLAVRPQQPGRQQSIEMCRVVDTVLVDQETVYAPRHGNDRLLLGLKGSLNEYELDLVAAAFARRPLREGPPRRTRRRRACKLHQGGRSLREGPGPPRAGGHQLGLRQSPGARQRTTGSALVSGA